MEVAFPGCSMGRIRAAGAAERSGMLKAVLKKLHTTPALRHALVAVVAVLWLVGLADQLPDLVQTAKYVGISLLMLAVAVI